MAKTTIDQAYEDYTHVFLATAQRQSTMKGDGTADLSREACFHAPSNKLQESITNMLRKAQTNQPGRWCKLYIVARIKRYISVYGRFDNRLNAALYRKIAAQQRLCVAENTPPEKRDALQRSLVTGAGYRSVSPTQPSLLEHP